LLDSSPHGMQNSTLSQSFGAEREREGERERERE
jgi:hypothetical protein